MRSAMQKMSAERLSVSAEINVIWQKLCANCRAELEAQMRDKEDAKKREKAERLVEDLKLHQEAARYNPWGKDKPGSQDRVPSQPSSHSQSQVNRSTWWKRQVLLLGGISQSRWHRHDVSHRVEDHAVHHLMQYSNPYRCPMVKYCVYCA